MVEGSFEIVESASYWVQHLRIERLIRRTHEGESEELRFFDGLNFVVGPPNVGKTQWIRMLDFLLGDSEPFLSRFPGENFMRYDSISADVRIGDERCHIERFLQRDGKRTKVFIDEEPYDLMDFQRWLLAKLNYPPIRYPRGVISLEQAWPALTFRTMFRHMYRQQRFWGDLADRQTAVETSVCLLQFLGLANEVYNEDLENIRNLRELTDRHAVEIYACRMALLLLSDRGVQEMPPADALGSMNPERIVSSLKSQLSELEAGIGLDRADIEVAAGFDWSYLNEVIAKARSIGESTERLRFAEILNTWSAQSETNLKVRQQEVWEISQRIRAQDLSDLMKERTDFLCSAMNEYLAIMNQLKAGLWRHSDIRVRISRRMDLRLCVGNMQWDRALGGSDSLLFLLAYHYGLLSLSVRENYLYPGLVVLDFPAYFRGQMVSEIEGLVARPFADLLEREAFATCQVIFIGSSFAGEDRGNRIELTSGYLH